MTLTKDGVRFKIEQASLDALVASLGDPRAPVVVRGCRRCKAICTDARPQLGIPNMECDCCKGYGANFGGGRHYYEYDPLQPDSKKNQPGHVSVTTLTDLAAKLGCVA